MSMRDDLDTYDAWVGVGKDVAVATVIDVVGSAPRPVGSRMLISSDGEVAGSVSGGCVESDVVEHATPPRTLPRSCVRMERLATETF